MRGRWGGGGGLLLYKAFKLYWFVRPQRVRCLSRFNTNMGLEFGNFVLIVDKSVFQSGIEHNFLPFWRQKREHSKG